MHGSRIRSWRAEDIVTTLNEGPRGSIGNQVRIQVRSSSLAVSEVAIDRPPHHSGKGRCKIHLGRGSATTGVSTMVFWCVRVKPKVMASLQLFITWHSQYHILNRYWIEQLMLAPEGFPYFASPFPPFFNFFSCGTWQLNNCRCWLLSLRRKCVAPKTLLNSSFWASCGFPHPAFKDYYKTIKRLLQAHTCNGHESKIPENHGIYACSHMSCACQPHVIDMQIDMWCMSVDM